MKTAAKLIKIRNKRFNVEKYLPKDDIELHENRIVPLLRLFMKELTSDELNQSSIGQAKTKAVSSKPYIPPLLFVLEIEVDHKYASKWLPKRSSN